MNNTFDKKFIGSRMSDNYITIPTNASIKEAMNTLIRKAAIHSNISILYLTDSENKFRGAVYLKDLIVARADTNLSEITVYAFPRLYADEATDACIPYLTDYAEMSVSVLDRENHLLGVVTASDLIELVDNELGDDYAKLAGLPSEEDLSETVTQSVKKRLPWLCILLFLSLGVSAVIGIFESVVAQLPIIMCFQSMILDMSGNVGTQSLAVAIRVLADSPQKGGFAKKLTAKEARIGLANGVILGVLSFIFIGIYLFISGNTVEFSLGISGCLGFAMMTAMTVSAVSGTVIPAIFKSFGADPAAASGPLITTLNDLTAVIVYYGTARLILINLMHI